MVPFRLLHRRDEALETHYYVCYAPSNFQRLHKRKVLCAGCTSVCFEHASCGQKFYGIEPVKGTPLPRPRHCRISDLGLY